MRITLTLFLSPTEPAPRWVKLLAAALVEDIRTRPGSAAAVTNVKEVVK